MQRFLMWDREPPSHTSHMRWQRRDAGLRGQTQSQFSAPVIRSCLTGHAAIADIREEWNIQAMDTTPRPRFVLLIVGVLALAVATGSIILAEAVGDPVGLVFHLRTTGPVVVGVLVWAVAALAVRSLIVGKFPSASVDSRAMLLWGGSRFVLLLAVVLNLVSWLISVALGLEVSNAFLRSLVFLIVVSAFLGIAGVAFLNSVVTVRSWRRA